MKRENIYTEEMAIDYAINEYEKLVRRKVKGLKTRIFNACSKKGLRTIELQFDWLQDNPSTEPLVIELDHENTLLAWRGGIKEYKDNIGATA